jgi:hypothetical protein
MLANDPCGSLDCQVRRNQSVPRIAAYRGRFVTPTPGKTSFGTARPIPGGVGMEDEMRPSRSISAKTTLACGFLLTALPLALAAPTSAAEARNHAPVIRHLSLHHHQPVDSRTTALVPAATGPFWPGFFGSYVPAPRKPETDGLSRNPDDCVKYGCIDNGGG